MRVITTAMIALGFAGAIAVSNPTQTKAQGVTIYGPGVEVDIGQRRYPYRRHYNDGYRYNNGYDAYGYYRGPYQRRWNTWNGCPPNYTIQDGACKPYRGY